MEILGIPKNETIWVRYHFDSGEYYITSKETREFYFLYKFDGKKAVKLGKAKNPQDLEEKFLK